MLKQIGKRYRNLKFRWKIALVCIIAGLLPMLLLGYYCYGQIRALLLGREERALNETLAQASGSLSQRLDACRNAMALVAWDKNLGQAVERNYLNNYEMYEVYQYLVDPLFLVIRTVNKDIVSSTLYTSANLYPHGETVRPLGEARELPWYQREEAAGQKPFFHIQAGQRQLSLISPVLSSDNWKENYVEMKIDYNTLFSPLDTLLEGEIGVLLFDQPGQDTYFHRSGAGALSAEEALRKLEDGSLEEAYMYVRTVLPEEGWNLVLYRPLQAVYANTQSITLAVLLVAAGCALLLYLLTFLLSRAVVRPLENLTRNMREIEDGDLSVNLPPGPTGTDEVGLLVRQFASMVRRLQYLINEVYKNRIARQEYEMKALQAQINPHFFYNSLSLINSKAIIAGQEDISRMAQLLSTFYRTTLNRGESTITVAEEWTNTVSYVRIQLMMHHGSFEVAEDLDPSIREYVMPNLLLQPLAENAIVHGIDHKVTPGPGRLEITGCLDGGDLRFTVRDNGCGIPPERLETLLTKDHAGYGVQNVHRRVRLYYGEPYGLRYESGPDQGTSVYLTLPARKELFFPTERDPSIEDEC